MAQENARYPIVFVTGVGQTWTSLKGDHVHRWNLFARDKDIIFGNLSAEDKLRFGRVAAGAARALLTGRPVSQTELRLALTTVLRFCYVDDDGRPTPIEYGLEPVGITEQAGGSSEIPRLRHLQECPQLRDGHGKPPIELFDRFI